MFLSSVRKLFCHWSSRIPKAMQMIVKQISHTLFDVTSGDTDTNFSGGLIVLSSIGTGSSLPQARIVARCHFNRMCERLDHLSRCSGVSAPSRALLLHLIPPSRSECC